MTDKPPPEALDLDDLAKRYIDLWTRHMGSLSCDPALAQAMAQALTNSYQAMGEGMAAFAQGFSKPGEAHGPQSPRPRSQADVAASGRPDGQSAGLDRRLAALEKRVAVLERAVLKPGPGARKRKPRSA